MFRDLIDFCVSINLTRQQTKKIIIKLYDILDERRAFGYQHIAQSTSLAIKQLFKDYGI